MIGPEQIARVQESFVHCLPIPDKVATAFYTRLFAIAPETRRLFTSDMTEQGRKLVMTLAAVVDGLDRLDEIVPVARELAIRHVRYGVVDAHYAMVGRALVETLRDLLGPMFDSGTEEAWRTAYALAAIMVSATRGFFFFFFFF